MNPIRLSELAGKISDAIHRALDTLSFWVIADITSHSFRSQKGYHNFELVEKDPEANQIIAKIPGKAWGTGSSRIADFEKITGQRFTNNIQVLVRVTVHFHPVFGLQVNINDIDPNFTLGVLERQRQATLEKLVTDNPAFIRKAGDLYFTRNNQLSLNPVLQHIAVISSATSAGAEDFKHTLLNNAFGYRFLIDDYYSVVQGTNNAAQLLAAIIKVFEAGKPYDAVVIIRGGGAQTDFLIFDDYSIGRAIAKFPIPVITGIGHQKNETIVDLMAHTATKTPTKAAEFIIARNRAYEEAMLSLQKVIIIKSQQLISAHFQVLARLNSIVVNQARDMITRHKDDLAYSHRTLIHSSRSVIFYQKNQLVSLSAQVVFKPQVILYNRLNDMKHRKNQLETSVGYYLKSQKGLLSHHSATMNMMHPTNILKKGFALIQYHHKLIDNPEDIPVGEDIDIVLRDTRIQSTVKQKSKL